MIYRITIALIMLVLANIVHNVAVESKSTPIDQPEDEDDEVGVELSNKQKFSECSKIKRIEDCLPILYSTAILAAVTAFLLSLCGAFLCCMVCCAAKWRMREARQRMQFTGYALVSTGSAHLMEVPSPTLSSQYCTSRFDPDPPPKYPGESKEVDIFFEDDPPPPPYTPSFKSKANNSGSSCH